MDTRNISPATFFAKLLYVEPLIVNVRAFKLMFHYPSKTERNQEDKLWTISKRIVRDNNSCQ